MTLVTMTIEIGLRPTKERNNSEKRRHVGAKTNSMIAELVQQYGEGFMVNCSN